MTRRLCQKREVTVKAQRMFSALSGFVVVTLMASFGMVGEAIAADPVQIVIPSQETNSGQVLVSSATAAEAGWLVISRDTSGIPSAIVGYVPVHQGVNTNFTVDINTKKVGASPVLYAMLYVDRDVIGVFQPGLDVPAPGSPLVAFGTTGVVR